MKLRNLMFIGVAAAAMFVGCKEEEVLKPAAVEIQPEALTFTTEAETKEVSLLATRNWKAEVKGGGDWLTVEPMSGEGSNDAQTVRVSVIKNEEGPKAATVIFSASNLETELKVTQDGVEGGATTIAYFLAQEPSDEVWYTLTGEITEIKDTKHGNFTIKDETGSVYVYGLTEKKTADGSNDQSFKYLNLKVGDKLTLCGTRAEFKGEAQVGGTAYYISHVSAPVEWPEDVTPISEILKMTESDVQVQTTGIVYGTYKKGVVIKDKETGDYLIVYDGGADAPFAKVGDEINVVGTTYLYNDQVEFMEINYLDHKVVSENNNTVETDAPAEITAATIDAFDKTKASYISFEGILTQSGNYFNVIIDGADFTGSLSNVIDPSALADYVDEKVVVTGYYCSTTSKGKYFNIMYTDIDIVTDPWVYLPETSFGITSDAQSVKFTVNSNSAWTIASSDPAYIVSPEDGTDGTAEVTVTCPENTGTTEKVVTLTITAGKDVKTVTITQAAPLAGGDQQAGTVGVQGAHAVAVVDDHIVAVAPVAAGAGARPHHGAAVRGLHAGAVGDGDEQQARPAAQPFDQEEAVEHHGLMLARDGGGLLHLHRVGDDEAQRPAGDGRIEDGKEVRRMVVDEQADHGTRGHGDVVGHAEVAQPLAPARRRHDVHHQAVARRAHHAHGQPVHQAHQHQQGDAARHHVAREAQGKQEVRQQVQRAAAVHVEHKARHGAHDERSHRVARYHDAHHRLARTEHLDEVQRQHGQQQVKGEVQQEVGHADAREAARPQAFPHGRRGRLFHNRSSV